MEDPTVHNDDSNGYVREKLFKERTGNIQAAIDVLFKKVEKGIETFLREVRANDLKHQEHTMAASQNKDAIEAINERLGDPAVLSEQKDRSSTLKIAIGAMIFAGISCLVSVGLGIFTVIIK